MVIGAGAKLLGAIDIGDGARVGAGSVVVQSVPSHTTVVGVPGRAVGDARMPAWDLEHGKLPDPVSEAIRNVLKEQADLAERLRSIEESLNIPKASAAKKDENPGDRDIAYG